MAEKRNTQSEAMLWYTQNVKEVIDHDGLKIYLPENTNYYYEKRFIKLYQNCLADMMQISGCSRHLLDWLVEIMGQINIVNNNEHTRQNFKAYFFEKTGKRYGDEAIVKAYKQLIEKKFLIKYKRGLFLVNPEYFFNGDEGDRKTLIKLTLEFKAGVRTEISLNSK
jgi:hypothetical protein